MGQVYVPQVNWFLAISTMVIVVAFQSSAALAAAYGIAVALTMTITGTLLPVVALERWGWPLPLVIAGGVLFAAIDLSFVGANLLKVLQGGWFPLVIAAVIFTLMTTWKTGRRLVAEQLTARANPLKAFVESLAASAVVRVPGTAVFMTAQAVGTPPALAHNVRFNKILHECVVVLQVRTLRSPYVAPRHRISMEALGNGVYDVWLQYGFMEDPDVPSEIERLQASGVPIDPTDVTYFLGRETIVSSGRPGMALWREKLFVVMARNAGRPGSYFKLPPERVIEVGVQVEM
jgi:KUP system potassium uptake protein